MFRNSFSLKSGIFEAIGSIQTLITLECQFFNDRFQFSALFKTFPWFPAIVFQR